MAAVSNSVVHLTMRFHQTVLSIGTGCIYEYNGKYYIVTAWHNLSGLHSETLRPLSAYLAIPDNVIVRFAVNVAGLVTYIPVTVPLLGDEKSLFLAHPDNWPRVDVAVIPFNPEGDYLSEIHLATGETRYVRMSPLPPTPDGMEAELCPVQKYLAPNAEIAEKWLDAVEVTEELFIPGYPHNIQDFYSQPVWKRATVASSVQLGWDRMSKFLVDSASASGMSGSPVFFYSPNGAVRVRGTRYQFDQEVAILVGVYVGRIGINRDADPQIGTVWKSSVIDDIIDAGCFERLPGEIELPSSELSKSAKKVLSGCSRKGLENVKDPDCPSRYFVREQFLKEVNGRASPERALEVILEEAEDYDGPLVPDETE